MLRFQPDSWPEGLLRPVLLADPAAGLYYEDAAPDWRFAALALVLLIAGASGRFTKLAGTEHRRTLLMLAALFYVWTFAIGNGRYFVAGLMMVGPLLVMAWHWLPGTRAFRWTLLLCFMAIQAHTVHSMYRPGAWSLAGWTDGPAVDLAPSPLRERPAVFITLSAISYSVLVPRFHPESRWANLAGQVDVTSSRPEYALSRALVASPLPKYVVLSATSTRDEPDPQPGPAIWRMIRHALGEHGLEPAAERCDSLRTNVTPRAKNPLDGAVPPGAFWVCPIQLGPSRVPGSQHAPTAMDDVFARLEAYCPRFFPPGGGVTKRNEDHWLRYYLGTDTRAYVEDAGFVTYKYFRNFTPTVVGSVDEVRQGRFSFSCEKLAGRYRPPWQSN